MMSPATIQQLSDDAARKAAREHKQPYVLFDRAEVERAGTGRPFPFPFIGSYVPKGWKLVDTLFCDSSGVGQDDEAALSVRQLKAKLIEHVESAKKYGYAVIETGQFQIHLGVFERTSPPKARKVYPYQWDDNSASMSHRSDRWASSDRGWLFSTADIKAAEESCGHCTSLAHYLDYSGHSTDEYPAGSVHAVIVGRGVPGTYFRTVAEAKTWILRELKINPDDVYSPLDTALRRREQRRNKQTTNEVHPS